MNYMKNRKYSRASKKIEPQNCENELTLSAAAAVGVLVLTFAKGLFWGYMIKKKLSDY